MVRVISDFLERSKTRILELDEFGTVTYYVCQNWEELKLYEVKVDIIDDGMDKNRE